jgi:Tfp pilus assembly protein PilN
LKSRAAQTGPAGASSSLFAALDEHAGGARLAIVRRGRASDPLSPLAPLTIVETRDLQGPDALAQAGAALRGMGVATITRIAPGGSVVVRCVQAAAPEQTGEAGEASLAASAGLLAEAELPEDLPAHRRSAGAIPDAGRAGVMSILLAGWRGDNTTSGATGLEELWTTRPAALAMLRAGAGRLAACIDAAEGVITLIASGPARTVAREILDDASDGVSWKQEVLSAAAGAWDAAGGTEADLDRSSLVQGSESSGRRLVLEPASLTALSKRISGMREGQAWLDTWGLAIGAALIAADSRVSVRGLGEMTAIARDPDLSLPQRFAEWIGRGPRSAVISAAAILALFLIPLGMTWARSSILDARAAKVEAIEGRDALERQAAFYAQLESTRWPMTKIIADVGAQAPVGVVVTNLRMSPGQPLTISGRADSSDLVNTMVENLSGTKIFAEVSVGRQESKSGGGVEFDLSARVVRPFIPAKRPEDFVATPLAVRLHGEGATNTTPPAGTKPVARTSSRRDESGASSGTTSTSSSGASGSSGASSDRRPSPSRSTEPPAPIADDAIAKLDRNGAMKEWSTRAAFVRSNPNLEASTKERLSAEVEKLKARMDATRGGGA